MLDRSKILELFARMDQELGQRGVRGEIGVVGGAAMCLLFQGRQATKDIDAVFEPSETIRTVAKEIAQEENLPSDWLNDAVKGFFSSGDIGQQEIVYSGSSLMVWVPDLKYLFAMKALASRVDSTDKSDIEMLIEKLGLRSLEEAIALLKAYYPQERIPERSYYFLEELFGGSGAR